MGRAIESLSAKLDRAEVIHLSAADRALVREFVMVELASKGLLDRSPKKNWVEEEGGLPAYIEEVANSLHTKRGMPIQKAIQVAVGRIKAWAHGGGNVDADTVAKAQKALAQWEKMKASAKARPNK